MIVGLVYRFVFVNVPLPEEEIALRRRKESDRKSYYLQAREMRLPVDAVAAGGA